ncbi:FtsL-like putative cell division protein [Pedobacter helvus]|uniref:FtsL-like putative cell division protein n=1 Tax=Pedobacter helvus TaxID=2563444 RepID=A0ABW9JPI3_9SPHI|nr:FtsL-like putative cell division protein [Pedobacter ureilyticus]
MNRFREKIEDELAEEDEPVLKEKEEPKKKEPVKEGSATAFFRKLFVDGAVSKEAATDMLPYLVFLCVLGMIYIANSHMAVKNIRDIDRISKEVKELSWEYKSLKADLMFKSKMTEVAKKVDTLGLEELVEPPKKIIVQSK